MAAAQSGDASVYEQLLREILPMIRALVRSRLGTGAAAEDVVQNVLLSVHRGRHTYRPERPFLPWLRAIARNAVIDAMRVERRRAQLELPIESLEAVLEASPPPRFAGSPRSASRSRAP
jgi:RNA polymerase sigma-70 factor (ECF subfamily)